LKRPNLKRAILAAIVVFAVMVPIAHATEVIFGWFSASYWWALNEFQMASDLYYQDYWGNGIWQRIVRPETWEGYWTQDRIDPIRNNGGQTAVVYHSFKAGGNCYAPFNFLTSTEYTNFESYRVEAKGAGC